MTVKYILEIKNRRSSAVIYVKEERGSGMYEFYIMQIQGVRGCPHYCSFIVDAKRYVSGMKTKNKVDVLSRTG